MMKAEAGGVQGGTAGAAGIGHGLAVQRPIVDCFATKGRALLRQMNAYLVCASGLQAAFHQRIVSELFQDPNMGYGALTLALRQRAAAPAVAPVIDQHGLNSAIFRAAAHQGEIAALERMRA